VGPVSIGASRGTLHAERAKARSARANSELMKGRMNMTTESNLSATLKAYQDKINTQVKEAKTRLEELETKAKEQNAQAEVAVINRLKTTKENIDRKLQNLKTTNEAQAAQAKADIDAEVAKLKSSVDELATKFKMHVTK
jgi:uncharacterized protein YicC (UPF0701 family)